MYRLVVFLYLLAIALGDDIPRPKSHRNRRPHFPTGKIVGGVKTPIEDVPYQVAVMERGDLVCGGSIITKRHILSAHSCINSMYDPPSNLSVRTGSSDSRRGGTVIKVKSFKGHPKWNFDTDDYDVSVMELMEDIELNSRSAIIPLAKTEAVSGNALVSGWGYNLAMHDQLHSVSVPIVNRTACEEGTTDPITARMICAGENGKDFCEYDRGGPLVAGKKDMRTQVGIASASYCGDPDFPGVYTNIADPEIRAFIKEQAGV